LTEKFSEFVQALKPEATAHAQAFGENCVYSDGNCTFLAKETDYYVQLPPEEIRGPQPSFVEFIFIRSETERTGLRVPIQQYKEIAPGKTAIELFRFCNIPPTSPT